MSNPANVPTWSASAEYVNGDLVIDQMDSKRAHLLVYWDGVFHQCWLTPTHTNIEAMAKLFASIKDCK